MKHDVKPTAPLPASKTPQSASEKARVEISAMPNAPDIREAAALTSRTGEALLLITVGLIFMVLAMASQLHPPTTAPSRALFRFFWEALGPMSQAFSFYFAAFTLITMGASRLRH
ncbi:MAG: hypothetical protein EOO28_08760 [Comamonadaceae bacterium]|nr:MAG: hypothetical protein EOO28_08760 [Comamonadaceae bacterium]